MSKESKVHMPLYVKREMVEAVDVQREALAEELGVSNISRGDYLARLVKEKETELQTRN